MTGTTAVGMDMVVESIVGKDLNGIISIGRGQVWKVIVGKRNVLRCMVGKAHVGMQFAETCAHVRVPFF
jgi:hypothetical protein